MLEEALDAPVEQEKKLPGNVSKNEPMDEEVLMV